MLFDKISSIFSFCEVIECDLYQYSNISLSYFVRLIEILINVNNNKKLIKLKQIKLIFCQYTKQDYNLCLSVFKKQDWNWHIKVDDDINGLTIFRD